MRHQWGLNTIAPCVARPRAVTASRVHLCRAGMVVPRQATCIGLTSPSTSPNPNHLVLGGAKSAQGPKGPSKLKGHPKHPMNPDYASEPRPRDTDTQRLNDPPSPRPWPKAKTKGMPRPRQDEMERQKSTHKKHKKPRRRNNKPRRTTKNHDEPPKNHDEPTQVP